YLNMMLTLVVLVASLSVTTATTGRVARSCGTCEPSLCDPLPAEGCKFGTMLDSCGCCEVCAAGLGEPCGGRGASAKRCGSGMECVKEEGEQKNKFGICVCKSDYEVCGTDGVTYKTGCDLKDASMQAVSEDQPEIKVANKGKCAQAPIIVTPPKEIYNVTGSQVFLSCEAIGISPLTEAEAGEYECHAVNSKGEASAVGSINV
ncbi:hypothetical protein JZ751_011310, partial [Albula glossodonta]